MPCRPDPKAVMAQHGALDLAKIHPLQMELVHLATLEVVLRVLQRGGSCAQSSNPVTTVVVCMSGGRNQYVDSTMRCTHMPVVISDKLVLMTSFVPSKLVVQSCDCRMAC